MDARMALSSAHVRPRVIIHGGAGNITPDNLDHESWQRYRTSLSSIVRSTDELLHRPETTALDAAVHAVSLLENDPLFNAGKGAVFNRDGEIELEASVMVSRGLNKRGAAVSLVKTVKHPIKLAAEILKRGQDENGGGGQGHVHLSGPQTERLAKAWGLEMVDEKYFWTKKRWQEHKRGLEREHSGDSPFEELKEDLILLDGDASWDGKEYLPQGTVGCVVLDRYGTLAAATSTGGLTNKLPGRIGDTPTFGAGFWAEEWPSKSGTIGAQSVSNTLSQNLSNLDLFGIFKDCFPQTSDQRAVVRERPRDVHAVAMSGTGNGDSFLRMAATRSAAAMSRFSAEPLQTSVSWMIGPNGEMQKSAGERWRKTGEGEGGIIGIELWNGKSNIVWDLNCGGMFRAWIDDDGVEQCFVFREEY